MSGSRHINTAILDDDDHFYDHTAAALSSPATLGWAVAATGSSFSINHGWEAHNPTVRSLLNSQKNTNLTFENLFGKIEDEWILDSGCSYHMTGRKIFFHWSSPRTCFFNKCWAAANGPTAEEHSTSWSGPAESGPTEVSWSRLVVLFSVAQVDNFGVGQSTLPDTAQHEAPPDAAHTQSAQTQYSAGPVQTPHQDTNGQTNFPIPSLSSLGGPGTFR
ncbi:hypothetical protein M9H77_35122 [Catharanthus roseus]|uniref:Uncharacterized protein n=1 Tax=Catharanthus roseus TaxID=4058 RepID=A0ACB9ZN40_CATRO|nr:hypothetical protein M9H77_35122 [Catharanthus roseus]